MNPAPLTAHIATAFNSTGASTLVAFVGSHPLWNGLPANLAGITDNLGNTWQLLAGPATWPGRSFSLMSAIYYVNTPVTSATHTITVHLTNRAPVVTHVFAVSGSDITGPPLSSPITDPGATTTTHVTSQSLSVPAGSLLLGWAKNEEGVRSATAASGFALDRQSVGYLWAESQTVFCAGSYFDHFVFSNATGWHTAIVGLKPPASGPEPVRFHQAGGQQRTLH